MKAIRILAGVLVCAAATFGFAAPALAVPGLEYVFAPWISTSGQTVLTTTAYCPQGKVVLGGGGTVSDTGRFSVTRTQPVHGGGFDSFQVTGEAIGHTTPTGDWGIGAWAICGDAPAGLEYVAHTASDGNPLDSHVSCTSGKKLLGLGGRVTSAAGRAVLDDVVPYTDLTGAYVRGYEVEGGDTSNWTATVYGVCAAPVAGQVLLSAATATDSATAKTASLTCPSGKRLHGMGGDIYNGVGQVMMTSFDVYQQTSQASVRAHEDATGYSGSWYARVWAICAT